MPQIVIDVPGDISIAAAQRFQATLPGGMTIKEGLLRLAKQRVRQKEKEAGEANALATYTQAVQTLRSGETTDPDIGGQDLP